MTSPKPLSKGLRRLLNRLVGGAKNNTHKAASWKPMTQALLHEYVAIDWNTKKGCITPRGIAAQKSGAHQ